MLIFKQFLRQKSLTIRDTNISLTSLGVIVTFIR